MTPWLERDNQTIYLGDNCDVLVQLPKASVDLVVTSPPYDDLRTYGGHSWDFYGVAWLLKRVLKPGGVIVWVVNDKTEDGDETGTSMRQALHFKEIGLRLHDTMIWSKTSFMFPEVNRYQPAFEYMFVLSNGAPNATNMLKDRKNKWAGTPVHGTGREANGHISPHSTVKRGLDRVFAKTGARWNVWEVDNPGIAGNKHPATYPEAIARDHILSWSNEGDTVLDPFLGSGTTLKMARECGRKGIGVEVCEEYCQIAKRRLDQGVFAFTDQS